MPHWEFRGYLQHIMLNPLGYYREKRAPTHMPAEIPEALRDTAADLLAAGYTFKGMR